MSTDLDPNLVKAISKISGTGTSLRLTIPLPIVQTLEIKKGDLFVFLVKIPAEGESKEPELTFKIRGQNAKDMPSL